jgi:uncharacterized protein (DUF983 family)
MPHEIESEQGLTLAGWRRSFQLFARALTLRCPNCGGRPMLVHWFRMRDRCPRCGLRVERDRGGDYWIGSMMFNLVLAELLFAAVFVTYLVAVWPDVPWDAMEIIAPIMMALAPLVLFPFSKLVWLAFDLVFRPPRPEELAPGAE